MQFSVRVLNIKETGKTRGGLISGGGGGGWLITGCIFCLQVDGPIAGGGGLVSRRAYKRQFTVFVLSFEHVHFKWH